MTYPGSEQVSYTYNGQMMLESMAGTNIYIQSTTYDAAGRLTERVLGNSMTKAYSYYPWSQQGGRLQNLTAGSMQNMSYTYDDAGNVTTITDALAGPQTQEFSYNAADMVTHAGATGGTYGLYSENYSYSSGNLYNKGGVTNTYGDPDHPHAVTARSNGNTYVYDDNGNQTRREIGNDTYDLKYDAENRLVEVKKNSTVIATFAYDGDGKQVKGTVNGVTTYYVGAYYQKQETLVTKYYYAGVERVAMRQGGVLYYIFGDHLGSTAVVKNTQGGKTELRYTAWGTTRYEYGSTPTDRRYTGQREEDSLGLYFYNARWYDPALGRFIQADTIVPGAGNPQAWDRYAYTSNNPVKYTDPTGHRACADVASYGNCITEPIEKKRSQPPQPPVGPGGGKACTGQYKSILCLPTTQTPEVESPILSLQQVNPLASQSYEGYSDPDFDALLWFWDKVASPLFDSVEMYNIYRLSSKGGWKAIRYTLPTGPLEATVAALRQGYRDSWTQNLYLSQRILRMSTVFGETLATDAAANLAGDAGAIVGAAGGPFGAAAGYGASAALVTHAGDRFWANTVNPWFIPTAGWGIWP